MTNSAYNATTQPDANTTKTNYRWLIAVMIFLISTVNYADRGVIGAVGPLIMSRYHLSIAQFGILASAFGWAYAPFQLIAGWLNTYIKPKKMYLLFVTFWSICIGILPTSASFAYLLVWRLLFGASEGAVFCTGNRFNSTWFPLQERARAVGLMGAGVAIGTLIVTPFAIYFGFRYWWGVPFIVLGIVGVLWVVLAGFLMADRPEDHRFVNRSECEYILADKGDKSADVVDSDSLRKVPWGKIFTNGSLWGTSIAWFCSAYVIYFMMAFLPTYLVKYQHVSTSYLPIIATIPWIAMSIGALLTGFVSDYVLKFSNNIRLSRSYLLGAYLVVLGILLMLITTVQSLEAIITLVSLAGFFNFMCNSLFFVVPVDVAKEFAAQASGFTIGIASLASIAGPLITGFLVQATGSFGSAFMFASGTAIVGGIVAVLMIYPNKTIEA